MKYLAALKGERSPQDENKEPKKQHHSNLQKLQKVKSKTKTPYQDKPQKVQKGVFTVFTVTEGSPFSEKAPCENCKHKESIPGAGAGCVYKTGGSYPNIWTLLEAMEFCPRGYWN